MLLIVTAVGCILYSENTPAYTASLSTSGNWIELLYMFLSGNLNIGGVGDSYGVRPVVSIKAGTKVFSGSGTAVDPWVITAP